MPIYPKNVPLCARTRVEALEGARDVEGAGSLKGRSLAEGMVDGTEGVGRNRHTQRKWSNSRARRKNFGNSCEFLGNAWNLASFTSAPITTQEKAGSLSGDSAACEE